MENGIDKIFEIVILIISVVAHEVAHGAVANYFGDPTAKNEGRLTLNPIKHLDLFGSIILPAILILTKAGFILGWAKPVPVNPYNFRHRRAGEIAVSLAGVTVNFIIAIVFAILFRFGAGIFSNPTLEIISYVVIINLMLAVFNLVPIPPLDGSKILLALLPYRYEALIRKLEQYGILVLIIFIIGFSWVVSFIVSWLAKLLLI